MLKWAIDCIDYLFYSFYKITRKVYSEDLGPALYAQHATLGFIFFSMIFEISLIISKFNYNNDILFLIITSLIIIIWWIFSYNHYSETNAKKIYKYFKGKNNRSFKIFWIIYILVQIILMKYL